MISVPLRDDTFIGRDDELTCLLDRIRDLEHGQSSVVVIRGERGSGKTRLLAELPAHLPANLRTVTVRCSPGTTEPGAMLRMLYDALAMATHREGVIHEWTVPRLLHEFRLLVEAVKPVAIIAEDIEFSDPASLDIFTYAPDLPDALLLATFTPHGAPVAIEEILTRIRTRGAYEITLAPLPPSSIERLVRRFRHRGKRPAPVVVERIVALSDGNPSVARDLFGLFGGDGETDSNNIVPAAIRSRCQRGLDQLDAAARRIVFIGAAIGREFQLEMLCGIAECTANHALEAVQQATAAGLLHEERRGSFAFEHALFREALLSQTSPSRGAPIHRRIAEALEASALSSDALDTVAEHWLAADARAIAGLRFEQAAETAAASGQHERAAQSLRRAVDIEDSNNERRVELLAKLAGALRRSGLEEEALNVYRELLACDSDATRGDASARALFDTMILSWGAGEIDRCNAIAKEILAMDLPSSSSVKALTLIKLAGMASMSGRHDETLAQLREAEERYTLIDPEVLAQFYQQRALATAYLQTFDDAVPDFERGIRYAERSANGVLHAQLLCNYGNLALHVGRNDIAKRTLSLACERSLEARSESKLHLAHASYVRLLQRMGSLREARDVLAVIEERDRDLESVHAYYAVVPMLEIGSMLDDRALIVRALECDTLGMVFRAGDDNRIVPVAAAYAAHYWYSGEKSAASDLLHRTLGVINSLQRNLWFGVLVAKFGPHGDISRARRLMEAERSTCDPEVAEAFIALFDAFVARRRGRNTVAGQAGQRSASLFGRIGWPFFEAQALEAAGSHARALAMYEHLGDVRDAGILRASLRPARYAAGHDVALTAREREIAALAASGLINKEIAARLGISVRTVDCHLQVVYGKLGIRSRWQIPFEGLTESR